MTQLFPVPGESGGRSTGRSLVCPAIWWAEDTAPDRVDDKISEGTSISEEIIGALAQSKVLVVVYSEQYLRRNACQEELRRVFVAAQEEGDPGRRIIVV